MNVFLRYICMICLVFLAACTEQGEHSTDNITLRFWHFWSEPGQRSALKEIVSEFEKQYNVQVELTELSWNDGKAKLQAAFNSGAPPDVVELGSDWIAQFSSAGVLLPLPLDSSVIHRFVSFSLKPAMWGGRLYAYPWTVDTRVVYTNRTLLSNAGWKKNITTLAEMLEAAETIHAAGAYGFGANGADAHRLYKKILPIMWTFGGDVVDESGKPTLYSPENIKAFELYADLSRVGYKETQRQLDASFLQGRIGIWMSGSWLIPRIRATPGLQAEAILMPGVGTSPGLSIAGGEYLAVTSATKNRQRSRELVQFLTNGKQALRLCQQISEAGFPADKETMSDTSLQRDPLKSVFARQLQYARMSPVHPQWLDLEAILENALVRVLLGEATPQSSLYAAQQEALRVLRLQ